MLSSECQPSVSVIIVNWNSRGLLKKCLRHLSSQTVSPERIIVVDNASSDGSGDLSDPPGNLSVVNLPENIGFAAANNRGIAESNTALVVLLNPDAFPAPDWIENLLNASQRHPQAGAFGSKQLCFENQRRLDGIGDCYHISGLVWRKRHGARQEPKDEIACEIFSPCAAAAMYRRQALIDAGGFDEDYFCYVEDVDLGFRLRLAGHSAIYVPDAVVYHVGSATTGGQHSDFSVYHGHRNLVWTYVKNMPGILFWLLLPLHLLLNVVTIAVFAARGQLGVILRSKRDAAIGIVPMWSKRRRIQARRLASVGDIWQALTIRIRSFTWK